MGLRAAQPERLKKLPKLAFLCLHLSPPCLAKPSSVFWLFFSFKLPVPKASMTRSTKNLQTSFSLSARRFPLATCGLTRTAICSAIPLMGAWLVYGGIYIEKLDLSGDTLRLEGPRGALSYSEKEGKPILIAFSKPVRIEIHLLQPINSLEDAEAVLSRVFFLGKDWAEHARPEFRLAKDSTSAETIYQAGLDHTKFPRPVQTPAPDSSEKAKKAKYQATARMTIVVDKSGNVTRIRIDRAAGMDLDDRAVERVKTWRFEPATRDGQKVAVEMPIEVSFNLY